jgi:hypothetical protein
LAVLEDALSRAGPFTCEFRAGSGKFRISLRRAIVHGSLRDSQEWLSYNVLHTALLANSLCPGQENRTMHKPNNKIGNCVQGIRSG